MTKGERRTYTPEFKEQIVKLYESGKYANSKLHGNSSYKKYRFMI